MLDVLGEKCGIVGVYGNKDLEASRLVLAGLWALQHRGQESSGISASDGNIIRTHTGSGLVAHVYDEKTLDSLPGYIAIGHNRYSTSGGSTAKHNQPVTNSNNAIALGHNGNLPSVVKLQEFLASKKISIEDRNDSELMFDALQYYVSEGSSIEDAVKQAYPLFTGVFCLVVMTVDKLIAIRDEYGIRPLSVGKLQDGYMVASETCALSTVNAIEVRDVKPGEMIVIDESGLRSVQISESKNKLDIFEFVYFARPDSALLGKRVNEVRRNLGKELAKEFKIKADVVIPVPDSAIPAALGYAQASGVPFDHGFIKNRYIHRTFIRPVQKIRENDVHMKLNPLEEVLKGKSVVVIDDSIVRGTTSKKLVDLLRSAGAKEVHMLISSPPIKYPDFYGIDTPDQKDLIASHMSVEEIRDLIDADFLGFLSYEGMIKATGVSEDLFSTSCFTGVYPLDILERMKEIKKV